MCRECRESFPHNKLQRKSLVSDPDMHHGTCDTHVPAVMHIEIANPQWRKKRSQRMRHPQFYVSARGPWYDKSHGLAVGRTTRVHIRTSLSLEVTTSGPTRHRSRNTLHSLSHFDFHGDVQMVQMHRDPIYAVLSVTHINGYMLMLCFVVIHCSLNDKGR